MGCRDSLIPPRLQNTGKSLAWDANFTSIFRMCESQSRHERKIYFLRGGKGQYCGWRTLKTAPCLIFWTPHYSTPGGKQAGQWILLFFILLGPQLVGFKGQYGILGTEPRLTACKSSALLKGQLLQPFKEFLSQSKPKSDQVTIATVPLFTSDNPQCCPYSQKLHPARNNGLQTWGV